MQQPSPLLEKLDWVFTTSAWATAYPSTTATALDMTPSDHCPCIVNISTAIPRSHCFRFENVWLKQQDIRGILQQNWYSRYNYINPAKMITTKMKNLRKGLRNWQAAKVTIKTAIANVRLLLLFLDIISDYRDLSLEEWNFYKAL
jgi:hypothetical protein